MIDSLTWKPLPAEFARQILVKGRDDKNRMLLDAAIVFNNAIFSTTVALEDDGAIEMIDEQLQKADVPQQLLPTLPALSLGTGLRLRISTLRAASEAEKVAASRPTALQALVELLLERALRQKASHRLIESFRSSQQTTSLLD